ncbi:hypothetical protein ES703_79722 [subsurface metagenome]
MIIVAHIVMIGRSAPKKPTANPAIMFVAAPVFDIFTIYLIGHPEPKYSVSRPIRSPHRTPTTTVRKRLNSPVMAIIATKAPMRNSPLAT